MYFWYFSGLTTRTSKFIIEWYVPHSSAQRPTYSPGWRTVTSNWLSKPGITSRLNSSSGTQKEWITSLLSSLNRIFLPVGRTRIGMYELVPVSETVAPVSSWVPSYRNCQFHLKATTSTVTSGFAERLSTYVWMIAV